MSNNYRQYLECNSTKSKRVISDYISRLNRGIRILGIDKRKFYNIKSSKQVKKALETLIKKEEFITLPKGSQGDIKTSFNKYIALIVDYEDIKDNSKIHLNTLHSSLIELLGNKVKRLNIVINSLQTIIDSPNNNIEWPKWLMDYTGIKGKVELNHICEISISSSKDQDRFIYLIYKYPKEASIYIALKAHLKLLSNSLE